MTTTARVVLLISAATHVSFVLLFVSMWYRAFPLPALFLFTWLSCAALNLFAMVYCYHTHSRRWLRVNLVSLAFVVGEFYLLSGQ